MRPTIHSRSCSKLLSPSSHSSGHFLLVRFLTFPTATPISHPPTSQQSSPPHKCPAGNLRWGHTYTTSTFANLDLLPLCSLPSPQVVFADSNMHLAISSPPLLPPAQRFIYLHSAANPSPPACLLIHSTRSTTLQPPCMIKAANFSAFPIPADAISSQCSNAGVSFSIWNVT